MAGNKRGQRLTEEEKKQENAKLRREMAARGMTSAEDQKRIVETLSMRNVGAYALVLFLPPIGIWYIWTRREKLYLNRELLYALTFVGIVTMIGYINLLVQGFSS